MNTLFGFTVIVAGVALFVFTDDSNVFAGFIAGGMVGIGIGIVEVASDTV